MKRICVAVCQILCIDGDREGNFRRVEYALETAARARLGVACFPESCILGWENPDAHLLAESIPGRDSDRVAQLARKHSLMIAIGMDEKDGSALYDSAVLFDRTGRLLLRHRKINVLPELMTPPYSQGSPDGIRAVDTELGRIGLLICADTFTEEHLVRMRQQRPDLLLVPYGWAAEPSEWPEHGRKLIDLVKHVARTVGCATVGCDLVGQMTHGPWAGRTFGGQSVVVSRDGKVLAVGKDRDVDVMVVEVDVGREDG
ncbi:MAG: carbon-nitrogen hydrolase family protein [Armatimonadota bacterium]